jgi:hypothetical protein
MTRRLVDIRLVFDQWGLSMLSREHLEKENGELRDQIAKLKRLLMAQLRRNRVTEGEIKAETRH